MTPADAGVLLKPIALLAMGRALSVRRRPPARIRSIPMIAIPRDLTEDLDALHDFVPPPRAKPMRFRVAMADRLAPTGLARANAAARYARRTASVRHGARRRRQT